MASGLSLDAFFDDLVRCETRLYNALGARLRAEHGIAASQFEFLRHLRDSPGARVGDLATRFVAGIGAISKGADRLEAGGWITRTPNPEDGRSSLLSLTSAGRDLVEEAETTFRRALEELVLPVVPADRLEAAADVIGRLRAALEVARVGAPTG